MRTASRGRRNDRDGTEADKAGSRRERRCRFLLKVNGRRPTRGMSSQLDYEMRMVGDYVRDIFESGDG
jgi:hypothetical protein